MIALHDACTAINAGEGEAAIVGCCNLILSPRMTATMQELGVSSPSGYCHTFDAPDGYARGEAVSAVYLKKLSDALRDGDPVRSVIGLPASTPGEGPQRCRRLLRPLMRP